MVRDAVAAGLEIVVPRLSRGQAVVPELGNDRADDVAQFVGFGVGEVAGGERLDQGLAGDPAAAFGGDDGLEERGARAGFVGLGGRVGEDQRPGIWIGRWIGSVGAEHGVGVFDEDGDGHGVAGAFADAPAVLGLGEAGQDEGAAPFQGRLERYEQRAPGGCRVRQFAVAGENGGNGG